jgi:L-cystine transport system substrate-binding protein
MKRIIFAVIVTILALGLVAACSKKSGNTGTVVKVAFGDNLKPHGFREENGKITGYDVEIFEELDKLWDDVVFEFDMMHQTVGLLGVETGKYQIASNGFFKNPPREEKFLFPQENMGWSPLNLAVKGDSAINSLEDMKGKAFVPTVAGGGGHYILSTYIAAHPEDNYTLNTIDRAERADQLIWVSEGRYDAYFGPGDGVLSLKEALGLDIKLSDIVHYEPTYPVFNKSSPDLVERYDTGIKT